MVRLRVGRGTETEGMDDEIKTTSQDNEAQMSLGYGNDRARRDAEGGLWARLPLAGTAHLHASSETDGGVGLALACDIRIASENASLTLSEAKLGLCPATISKYVIRELGVSLSREAMLSARAIRSAELHAHGVVMCVAAQGEGVANSLDSLMIELRGVSSEASLMCKEPVQAACSSAGSKVQDATIERLFKHMMRPNAPGHHGVREFQAGRKMDWDEYLTRRPVLLEKGKL